MPERGLRSDGGAKGFEEKWCARSCEEPWRFKVKERWRAIKGAWGAIEAQGGCRAKKPIECRENNKTSMRYVGIGNILYACTTLWIYT